MNYNLYPELREPTRMPMAFMAMIVGCMAALFFIFLVISHTYVHKAPYMQTATQDLSVKRIGQDTLGNFYLTTADCVNSGMVLKSTACREAAILLPINGD